MRILPEVMINIFRHRFTRKYPKERPEIPEGYRGKILHFKEKCIYCALCARNCPSHAITVDIKKKTWDVDYGQCVFCQQCEETCRDVVKKDAIHLSKEYELSDTRRRRFRFGDKGKGSR
jgi:hydrogenase-4 component H